MLRSYRYPVKGERLAEHLGVSIRTLYRDVAILQSQGAEIKGEAGLGYVLKPGFFLPPLMFTQTEMEALLLGGQWVSQFGDAPLSKAAKQALDKVFEVLPANIKNHINAFTLRVGPPASESLVKEDLSIFRSAIANQKKMKIIYPFKNQGKIEEIVWPFTIGYFTNERILVAWSEKDKIYKHFRTTKISSFHVLDKSYSRSKVHLFKEWQSLQLQRTKNDKI